MCRLIGLDEDKKAGYSTQHEGSDASEEGETTEHPDDEDDTGSFISETFSDEEIPADELPEEQEDEEDEEEAQLAAELAAGLVNLPIQPTIHLVDSSPPELPPKTLPVISSDTSTPPGSPDKLPTVAAPVPVNATAPASFSLGLGRPSTKPTRSSPLANAPISGQDSEDDTTEKLPQAQQPVPAESSANAPSTSPKPSVSKLPGVPVKTEPEEEKSTSRPKTPPLTSIFGPSHPVPKPAPFTLAPSTSTPGTSMFSIPLASSPSPKPTDSGTQATLPKTSSIFNPPVASTPVGKQPETPLSGEQNRAAAPLFPTGGLFGQKPGTPPTPSVFSLNPTPQTSQVLSPLGGGLFGQKAASASPSPTNLPPAPVPSSIPPPVGNSFEQKPPSMPVTLPAGNLGNGPVAFPPPPATTPVATVANRPAGDPFAHLEEGMQRECMNLFLTMARELEVVSCI